jgi:hypothetical protein
MIVVYDLKAGDWWNATAEFGPVNLRVPPPIVSSSLIGFYVR